MGADPVFRPEFGIEVSSFGCFELQVKAAVIQSGTNSRSRAVPTLIDSVASCLLSRSASFGLSYIIIRAGFLLRLVGLMVRIVACGIQGAQFIFLRLGERPAFHGFLSEMEENHHNSPLSSCLASSY